MLCNSFIGNILKTMKNFKRTNPGRGTEKFISQNFCSLAEVNCDCWVTGTGSVGDYSLEAHMHLSCTITKFPRR